MPEEIARKVRSLIQLDVDAIHAYQQAIDKITVPLIKEQLRRYKDDHERHVRELSERLSALGEEPPRPSPDLKGYLIEGFTALRSMTGTEGALKAMKTNEQLTNRRYDEARHMAAPAELHALLEANYEDERRHLAYFEQALGDRLWEA